MVIPRYPASRPLELSDKPLLDGIFQALQPRISEFTFANLYLFRLAHDYRLTAVDDSLVVLGRGYDGEEYFLAPLSGERCAAAKRLLLNGREMYGADEQFVATCLDQDDWVIGEDRDSFDYIYLRESLANLPGKHYHKKKNRVNYFAVRHAYRIEAYDPAHLEGCLALLEEWRRVRAGIDSTSLSLEFGATAEALRLAGELGLQGVVAIVEGVVKAFVLGEQLNADTSVCHFEKVDPFMEGLSQLIDREFNRLLFTGCTFVNREQDLGKPGLREAKLSYHPVELLKKYRVKRG